MAKLIDDAILNSFPIHTVYSINLYELIELWHPKRYELAGTVRLKTLKLTAILQLIHE